MASLRLKISRGGYSSIAGTAASSGHPDVIEIDVPIPERSFADRPIATSEFVQIVGVTFDKTAELVDAVRGHDAVDAEILDDDDEVTP